LVDFERVGSGFQWRLSRFLGIFREFLEFFLDFPGILGIFPRFLELSRVFMDFPQ
jgi:hypothetical protein